MTANLVSPPRPRPQAPPLAAPSPIPVPEGHVGPLSLPGTNRMVWWTGRVAIGLRYEGEHHDGMGQSALWIQDLMLTQRAS
jgi:hypothetical protein